MKQILWTNFKPNGNSLVHDSMNIFSASRTNWVVKSKSYSKPVINWCSVNACCLMSIPYTGTWHSNQCPWIIWLFDDKYLNVTNFGGGRSRSLQESSWSFKHHGFQYSRWNLLFLKNTSFFRHIGVHTKQASFLLTNSEQGKLIIRGLWITLFLINLYICHYASEYW